MKTKSGFLPVAASLLFFEACSLFSPVDTDKFLPQTIGEYQRNQVREVSSSWINADYKKPDGEIFYGVGPYSTAQEAQADVTSRKFCQPLYSAEEDTIKILKEGILKDKTGKEIGKILICREVVKEINKVTVGNYRYKITLSNDKNYIYLDGRKAGLADLTKFAETLPLNSQVDFAGLNLQPLINASSTTGTSADDLIKLNPPVKLAKQPYIKGKVLIARQIFSDISSTEKVNGVYIFDKELKRYGLASDSAADSYNEAETIIQITCSKGAKLGDYVTRDAEQKRFPAYASNCKVSVIDKTIPAIIAEKTFVGKDLSVEREFTEGNKEVRAVPPSVEIEDFIKSLPKR